MISDPIACQAEMIVGGLDGRYALYVEDSGYRDVDAIGRGVAFAAVAPTALFGCFMIADYPGPPGRFGIIEYFGWGALSLAIGFVVAQLLRRAREPSRGRLVFLLLTAATPLSFAALLYAEVQPSVPQGVKVAVEYTLQGVGAVAAGLLLLAVVRATWMGGSNTKSR